MPRISYDSETIFGKMTAEMIDHVLTARELANRIFAAADVASGTGATPTALESSSDFGVADGQGDEFWTYLGSVRTELNGLTGTFIASLDNGN